VSAALDGKQRLLDVHAPDKHFGWITDGAKSASTSEAKVVTEAMVWIFSISAFREIMRVCMRG
jgi:CRP-like cAMP-binding protein